MRVCTHLHADVVEHLGVRADGHEGIGDPHAVGRDGGRAGPGEDRVTAAEDVGERLDGLRQRAGHGEEVGGAVGTAGAPQEAGVRGRGADGAHDDAVVDVRNDLQQPLACYLTLQCVNLGAFLIYTADGGGFGTPR